MARGVLQRILDPHHIDQLFTQAARRQYTNELLFSSLVDLMARVVLGQEQGLRIKPCVNYCLPLDPVK